MDNISIFVESSEDVGILINSYEPLMNTVSSFLDKVDKSIQILNREPTSKSIGISAADINQFKNEISKKLTPSEIDIKRVAADRKRIKEFSSGLDKVLRKFARVKKSIAYGGNYLRAVIKRPKVYLKDISEENYHAENDNIRLINRAMDWIEKSLFDLYNLADQDLNILTIVDSVYVKSHIFEDAELDFGLDEEVADSVIPMRPTTEDTWFANTQDKKSGKVPKYLAQNHNMANYGEDDPKSKKKDEEDEPSLDSYRRKSADTAPKEEPDVAGTNDEEDDEEKETSKSSKGAINNYYYYTYTNSLNRSTRNTHNTNSFNRHDSHNTDDHSRDDHSKVINSHNHKSSKDDDDENKNESSAPWSLNLLDNDVIMEDTGDADDDKPESDHPVRDALMDIDRKAVQAKQKTKAAAQNVKMVGRAAAKPINRTRDWIINTIQFWKDKDETHIKEKMAEPHARSNLFNAIKTSIIGGSLLKAGLLLNPVFLFLGVTRLVTKNKREFRIRNEMIGELKNEMEIVDEKIKDADHAGDNKAKYQLMRFKNELNKKLLRVGGNKEWKKII